MSDGKPCFFAVVARVRGVRAVLVTAVAVFCAAVGSASAVAQDSPPQPAASDISITFFDANPNFTNDLRLPLGESADWDSLQAVKTERHSAAADGETLLLVRVNCPLAGNVRLTLPADDLTGALLSVEDLSPVELLTTREANDGRRVAYAVYRVPEEFGDSKGLERTLEIRAAFEPLLQANVNDDRDGASDKGQTSPKQAEPKQWQVTASLKLVRPPVVLVHGMYDSPSRHFAAQPPEGIGRKSMRQSLEDSGFQVFLCDYEESNGRTDDQPSRLRDNSHVVWNNPGGIREALEAYRRDGIAVTQADVVGHSMGGLLARVYARGRDLPVESTARARGLPFAPLSVAAGVEDETNWYLREDNFNAGDINRLITLCTPHRGSEVVGLLLEYPQAWEKLHGEMGSKAAALLQLVSSVFSMSSGAFLDQAPGSAALAQLGATPVPAFAIACEATPRALDDFGGRYRSQMLAVCLATPTDVLEEMLVAGMGASQTQVSICATLTTLIDGSPARVPEIARQAMMGMVSGRMRNPADEESRAWSKDVSESFASAVFGGQSHDGALTQTSALGGLPLEHTTTIRHVLHGYAPQYQRVQQQVGELLLGPMDRFHAPGFPGVADEGDQPARSSDR